MSKTIGSLAHAGGWNAELGEGRGQGTLVHGGKIEVEAEAGGIGKRVQHHMAGRGHTSSLSGYQHHWVDSGRATILKSSDPERRGGGFSGEKPPTNSLS
ncbi:hypothetical protein [Corynebacterium accolens]|uniref:hypothetical protein n=1 Tax=Corynebacterium accolens TaxID=38284 RepID=UPI0011121D55|nr:hypothetical protein [Corynebacterium accolens]